MLVLWTKREAPQVSAWYGYADLANKSNATFYAFIHSNTTQHTVAGGLGWPMNHSQIHPQWSIGGLMQLLLQQYRMAPLVQSTQ